VEATKIDAVAYKPNLAFFEALGSGGMKVLESLMDIIPPAKITIADAKRGDIGSTAEKYKEAFFGHLNADSITLNPLMGLETLQPFLHDQTKAVYILAMTSNRGASDFMQLPIMGRVSLGEYISEHIRKIQEKSATHIGMVVGATHPEAADAVLRANPGAHLLMPGIGAQGGDIELLEKLLSNHRGIPLINSSRAILYAGGDNENWEELIQQKASAVRQSLAGITAQYTG